MIKHKSETPKEVRDCWQTPLWLFDALDIEFGFWLDSAASDKNALCLIRSWLLPETWHSEHIRPAWK